MIKIIRTYCANSKYNQPIQGTVIIGSDISTELFDFGEKLGKEIGYDFEIIKENGRFESEITISDLNRVLTAFAK